MTIERLQMARFLTRVKESLLWGVSADDPTTMDLIAQSDNGLHVRQIAHQPGDRNASSTTSDYKRAIPTGTPQRFDIGASTETLVKASPAVLLAIIPNAAHTGNVLLRNAASTGGGSTPVFLLDLGPGEPVTLSSEFSAGITIEGTDAACDVTLVFGDL